MNKKVRTFFLLIIVVLMLTTATGCWDQKIFERTGFILMTGFETDEAGRLFITSVIPVIDPEKKSQMEIFSEYANSFREAREKIDLSSSSRVEAGKIQQMLFSTQVAEEGIIDFFEVLIRNAESPLLANLTIVDGSPEELMRRANEFENKQRSVYYINYLIENARKSGYLAELRTYRFDINYHSQTIDSVLPVIRLSGNEIEVGGSALFSGSRMVGKINVIQSGLLLTILGGKKPLHFFINEKGPDNDFIATERNDQNKQTAIILKNRSRKFDIRIEDDIPKIKIKMKFNASVASTSHDYKLNDEESEKLLEAKLNKALEIEYARLVKYMQECGSDPIGFGEKIRVKFYDYWKSVNWEKVYKNAEISVEAEADIVSYGAVF